MQHLEVSGAVRPI